MFDVVHLSLMYIPGLIFGYVLFFSDTIVEEYVQSGISGYYREGDLFPGYGLFLTLQFVIAILLLFTKFQKSDGIHRSMLQISIWSLLLGGTPAVLANLFVPVFTGVGVFPFVGTLSTAVWFGATSYVVMRKVT